MCLGLVEVLQGGVKLAKLIEAELRLYHNKSDVLFEVLFKIIEVAILLIGECEVHDHAAVVEHAHGTLLGIVRALGEGCQCVVAAVVILIQLTHNVETHEELDGQREAQANARAEFTVAAEVESDWVREAVLRRQPFFT